MAVRLNALCARSLVVSGDDQLLGTTTEVTMFDLNRNRRCQCGRALIIT